MAERSEVGGFATARHTTPSRSDIPRHLRLKFVREANLPVVNKGSCRRWFRTQTILHGLATVTLSTFTNPGLFIAMKSSMLPLVLRFALPIVMALALALPAWAQVTEHKLTASDGATEDQFGYSVSLADDRALMGAYGNDDLCTDSGSAYVYERQGDGSWLELAELTASDGAVGDRFGISV